MKSHAPVPATDTMVASSSNSVRVCNTCATDLHPDLVGKACWKKEVAASTSSAICFALVLPTRRLNTSPTTMSRTPPSGFLNAIDRPKPKNQHLLGNIRLCQRLGKLRKHDGIAFAFQQRKWSDVMPGGPAAAPLLAVLSLMSNFSLSNSKSSAGTCSFARSGKSSVGVREGCQRGQCSWCQLCSLQCLPCC